MKTTRAQKTKNIKAFLSKFPDNATSWAQATDELPDLHKHIAGYVSGYKGHTFKKDGGDMPDDVRTTPTKRNQYHKKAILAVLPKLNDHDFDAVYADYKQWFEGYGDGGRVWSDIHYDFTDEDGTIFIDAWIGEDDDEAGRVIAKVKPDKSVEYLDFRAKTDPYAQEVINQVISSMAQGGRPLSALARDRKYTSQQEWEQAYKGKRVSKVRHYKTHEEGGEVDTLFDVYCFQLEEGQDEPQNSGYGYDFSQAQKTAENQTSEQVEEFLSGVDDNDKAYVTVIAGTHTIADPFAYAQGGRPKSAIMRDRYNLNRSEKWEMDYAKKRATRPRNMAHGGSIPNLYEGKTPEQVWDAWTPEQRTHFIYDHFHADSAYRKSLLDKVSQKWSEIPEMPVKYALYHQVFIHLGEGQYQHGGELAIGGGVMPFFHSLDMGKMPPTVREAVQAVKEHSQLIRLNPSDKNYETFTRLKTLIETKYPDAVRKPEAKPAPDAPKKPDVNVLNTRLLLIKEMLDEEKDKAKKQVLKTRMSIVKEMIADAKSIKEEGGSPEMAKGGIVHSIGKSFTYD